MRIKIHWLFILVIVFVFGYGVKSIIKDLIPDKETITAIPEHPYYLLEDVNEEVLYNTLVHYEFPNPEIITAQAILETGNFKSKLCLDHNNLFGLYDSRKMEYMHFDSWLSCVFGYRKYILNRYKDGEDYYNYLVRIHYAEDPEYIAKLKTIVNNLKQNNVYE